MELTEASLAAARDARQQQANGWRTGAVSSTGRIRRRRFFKSVARAVKSIKQKKSSAKTSAKTSKVKKVPGRLKASKPQIEPIASNFRRSVRGAELIKQQMQTLLSLDKVAHPKYPAFDAESGLCRLKCPAIYWYFFVRAFCIFLYLFVDLVLIFIFFKTFHNFSVLVIFLDIK